MAEINHLSPIGIVVIGRNEGKRLAECLRSLPKVPTVYVDSGSTDNSIQVAKEIGISSVSIQKPFTAAKARNFGAAYLLDKFPKLQSIQFIDGDCILVEGWLESASKTLEKSPHIAAVYGNILEMFPQDTPYNKLLSMEWKGASGESPHFPGITCLKTSSWKESGGYNESIIAGEDSEYSTRLRLLGKKLLRIDQNMVYHDGAIKTFGQWWKRNVRAGHAAAERNSLHGSGELKECRREVRSIIFWGGLLPLLILLSLFVSNTFWMILLVPYLVLEVRIVWFRYSQLKDSLSDSCLYAFFCILGKFPSFLGVCLFEWNKFRQRNSKIIEYK